MLLNKINKLVAGFVFGAMLFFPQLSWAHAGEPHGDTSPISSGSLGGPIKLSEEAKKNLGIETMDADFRTIETTVRCFSEIEPVPTKVQLITTRFSGRVMEVFVNMGDYVNKGDLLAKAESLQIGNPPPQVEIRALASGTITEHHIFAGESVEPNKVLFKIVDLTTVYSKCHVFEADVSQIKRGQKSRVYLESFPNKYFDGIVDILSGQLEEGTRTLPVLIKIDNPKTELLPNMRAEGQIITGETKKSIVVERKAVLGEAGNDFVFVERGEFYVKQPVVVGVHDDRYVEIKNGLLPGDVVVLNGNYQLQFVPAYGESEKDKTDGKKDDKKKAY